MAEFLNPSLPWFLVFFAFIYYQNNASEKFDGASVTYELILNISALLGGLAALIYLGMYGYLITWWMPFALIIPLGIILGLIRVIVGLAIPDWIISLIGFIGLPVSGYFMFSILLNTT